jgi:DNA-binding response OmpR family regulator
MTRLLLVEDDDRVAVPLVKTLELDGFVVQRVTTVLAADASLAERPDLVLLDWRLPDGDGVDLLRRWRRAGVTVPVILVTARAELVDRVLGLELGADDYVTKPFEPRELIARIRARLRTHGDSAVVAHADLQIDTSQRVVRVAGLPVAVTRMEYALLLFLVQHPGQVFGREELLSAVWGYAPAVASRTVDTHVRQLRAKVGADRIESVRGVGYRLP